MLKRWRCTVRSPKSDPTNHDSSILPHKDENVNKEKAKREKVEERKKEFKPNISSPQQTTIVPVHVPTYAVIRHSFH